jgi:DNA-binding transcriptional MerR regulator
MKLTLGQVRDALGLSRDAYRHWQTVIVALSVRKGHRPCFTHGDLLALAIVKSLTDEIGVPVGKLESVARTLFEQCSQQPWTRFERQAALIYPENWTLAFVPDGQIPQVGKAAIVVPCGPIIAVLRAALTVEQPEDAQVALRFPLASVTAERGARKS